ncbi:MAG: universal stress protein [Sphingomonadales bacterium]
MKTILLHADANEGQESRLQVACDLARACDGHIMAVSVLPYAAYALADPMMGSFPIASLMDAINERRTAERTKLEARLAADGVSWDWHDLDGDPAERLVEMARLADVLVMSAGPFAKDQGTSLGLIGAVTLSCPAPVLAVPPGGQGVVFAGPALLAWDGGQEAAVAMKAALPLLALAESVTILTVAEKAMDFPANDAAVFLSRHGIAAEVVERAAAGSNVEQVIRSVLAERQISWMAQGAYGHSRVRQLLFGGVTRGLVSDAPVPLLLAH